MIESSREILERAIAEIKPYAIVSMISGGKDSLCAYLVARELDIPMTHIMHGVTGTGIRQTTNFVRWFAKTQSLTYLEANAGKAYEEYVRKKGFMGVGVSAHTFAYHILKQQRFQSVVSWYIRQNRKGRPILLLNGARADESVNRGKNLQEPISRYRDSTNIWVNVIHYWSRKDRDNYLEEEQAPKNPVTEVLCRSGECLCGTMQSRATREEASFYFPEWGSWLDELEKEAISKFGFGWGEQKSTSSKPLKPTFQPMCTGCLEEGKSIEGDK